MINDVRRTERVVAETVVVPRRHRKKLIRSFFAAMINDGKQTEQDDERGEAHQNWVAEVGRSEATESFKMVYRGKTCWVRAIEVPGWVPDFEDDCDDDDFESNDGTQDADVVTMGDFNEVRDSSERFGSVFNKHDAKLFNDFIAKADLTETEEKVTRSSDVVRIQQDIEKTEAMEAVDLEREVSKEEVKRAVWDCGIDKAPSPDGFTFGFYRRFWNLIECDVVKAVKWFFLHERIPSGGNSSFITLIPKASNANMVKDFRPISLIGSVYKIVAKILANRLVLVLGDLVSDTQSAFLKERQILDGPFILNELIKWCKKKKKQSMIFKVDFKKVYDSVRWDFVDTILKKFGFGDKWCKWIHSCLQSSRGSILINGSPTPEFQFFKGLKQGDPLSSFLFILWNQSNIDTIVRVLNVFHSASRLRINMKKSKLMGIVVDVSRVEQSIRQIGCMTLKMPFKYLGSVVRDRMSRVKSWNDVIDTLGIRARFFNGADNKVRKSSWVSWNQVMASKDAGGLVITAIHGDDGKIGKTVNPTFPSIWLNIIQEVAVIKTKGIDVVSFIKPKCGDGTNISFWNDAWRGDAAFKILAPRIYMLESIKDIQVATKLSHVDLEWSFRRKSRGGAEQIQMTILKEILEVCILSDMKDRWTWSLEGSGKFSVSSIRKTIDDAFLPCGNVKTRWVKGVPIKINILAWKFSNDYLPTKFNLSRRANVQDFEVVGFGISGD
nr:RNA-directed DNA polymerase, eukaryota [Tanacetum cinerariifolium]